TRFRRRCSNATSRRFRHGTAGDGRVRGGAGVSTPRGRATVGETSRAPPIARERPWLTRWGARCSTRASAAALWWPPKAKARTSSSPCGSAPAFAKCWGASSPGPPMSIDRDEVRRIADLARLEIADGDVDRTARELSEVLDFVAALNELDLTDCEPTSMVPEAAPLREDEVDGRRLTTEMALAAAPEHDRDFFLVPPVVENVNP